MAESTARSNRLPIQQLQTLVDLLETPALARIYVYVLQEGPVTVAGVVDEVDVPQGTAYDYVQKLETSGLMEKTRDKRPYEYDAEPISLTLSTDGHTQTITPALIAAVARREDDEDIDIYIDRHGLDGLAVALEYTSEYVDGTVNHRIAARELDLSPLEAEIILQALEPVVSSDIPTGETVVESDDAFSDEEIETWMETAVDPTEPTGEDVVNEESGDEGEES